MAITISGIRLTDIQIEPNDKGGYMVKSAAYSLISSTDKVLARQAIGGYQGMPLEPSIETKKALQVFATSYEKDVQGLLGLLEG